MKEGDMQTLIQELFERGFSVNLINEPVLEYIKIRVYRNDFALEHCVDARGCYKSYSGAMLRVQYELENILNEIKKKEFD